MLNRDRRLSNMLKKREAHEAFMIAVATKDVPRLGKLVAAHMKQGWAPEAIIELVRGLAKFSFVYVSSRDLNYLHRTTFQHFNCKPAMT